MIFYSYRFWHPLSYSSFKGGALLLWTWEFKIPLPSWEVSMVRFCPLVNLGTFSSVQLLSRIWLFVTPWTAARQASPSITNSWHPPKPMSIELVMPSSHLILCRPLLLPSILLSIRVSLSVSLFLFCRYVDLCHILFYFLILIFISFGCSEF